MKKYAKIINEETKQCEVGIGTNEKFYQSIGMTEQEVEQAYDGSWYLKGYAPSKPQSKIEKEVRTVRNKYLQDTDIYMIADYPITDEERQAYQDYRSYLRDYPESKEWWLKNPMTFEEWTDAQMNKEIEANDATEIKQLSEDIANRYPYPIEE